MHIFKYIRCIGCIFFISSTIVAEPYAIILAGGSGDRLWPLSTSTTPKQLLSLDGTASFLEQTIERIHPVVKQEHIWVCITRNLYRSTTSLVQHRVGNIVIEPEKRDTAAAIIYNCLLIAQEDPDATVLFMPSDAYIPADSYDHFRLCVQSLYDHATSFDGIILLGAQPTYPATGYGYIEYDVEACEHGFYHIKQFHEKPSEAVAQDYIATQRVLWNIGMFGGKVSSFIDAFKRYAPDIFDNVSRYLHEDAPYSEIRKTSIDYAILEKSSAICVLPVSFPWCDVGNLRVFLSLQESQKTVPTNFIGIESHNNLISAPGLVALVGVDNLCVVQKDDILLIVHQDAVEKVKHLVDILKNCPQKKIYV